MGYLIGRDAEKPETPPPPLTRSQEPPPTPPELAAAFVVFLHKNPEIEYQLLRVSDHVSLLFS